MKGYILFCILIPPVLCAQGSSGLLPDSINGWKKSGTTDFYIGDDLYRLIDGGADIFNEYGFNRTAVQRYTGLNDSFIDVEVYEMKDSSSAYGIFSLFTFNTGTRTDLLRDAFIGHQFLLFLKGKYYISLTGSDTMEETNEGLVLLAREIDSRIAAAGKPPLVARLNTTRSSKMAYVKGNLGLYNISKMNFGNDFSVEEGAYLEKGSAAVFVFLYGTDDEFQKSYLTVAKNFKSNAQCNVSRTGRYIVLAFSMNSDELKRISKEFDDILIK